MVKTFIVTCFVLLLAIPALAQDEFPRIQTSLGYANLSFPDLTTGSTGHHSGFANSTGLNLTKTLGFENYMGLYSLGNGASLISDFIGGKATYRAAKLAPYAVAGIGFGYLSVGIGAVSGFSTRYGGGVDVPINEILSWKVEVSRMSFHFGPGLDPNNPTSSWTTGTNIQAGVVFTLTQ
jgi:hypothetical protein